MEQQQLSGPHQTPVDVIDLSDTLRRLDGDRDLLNALADLFYEDAPSLVDRVTDGLEHRDLARVRHAAHTLKGLAANFGAVEAVAAGQLVESAAARSDEQAVRAAWPAFHGAVERLTRALHQLQLS